MPRARTRPSPSSLREAGRGRTGAQRLLAAALVLAALVLAGARGLAAAPRAVAPSVASLHAGSQPHLLDAAPPRVDAQLKRERVWLDLPLLPLAHAPRAGRPLALLRSGAPALGPGRNPPRDLRLSHFRRRIPRMNSEDPPWA